MLTEQLPCLFVNSAGAQGLSISFSGQSSIPEGGLVAQAVQDCGSSGAYYCEYRDDDTDNENLRPGRIKEYQIRITNNNRTDKGNLRIGFLGAAGNKVSILEKNGVGSLVTNGEFHFVQHITVKARETEVITLKLKGREIYVSDSDKTTKMTVSEGLTILKQKTITVKEDDNRAYIGRRNGHPYGGGAWNVAPCCFTENCAFGTNSCSN